MIILNKLLQRQTKLMKIADALNLLRPSFRLRNGCQQKRRKYPNDGDDDQQLNQSQTVPIMLLDSHELLVGEVA